MQHPVEDAAAADGSASSLDGDEEEVEEKQGQQEAMAVDAASAARAERARLEAIVHARHGGSAESWWRSRPQWTVSRAEFLRRFVEDASDRVVGVENRLEPHRTQSTRRLHQAVLECLAANESTYKFKPSVALKRHQSLNDLDVQDDDVALADASEQVPANDPAENAVAVAVN